MNIDLDTQEGRDFYVFKRQLFQLYEIQNRSIEEHDAFSFVIERENLKWLYNANQDFCKEMMRVNALEDLKNTHYLGGLVFKRKSMDPTKLKGLGCFGLSAFTYAYYPYVALHLGQTLSTFMMGTFAVAGMHLLSQREPIINTIEIIKEGEHAGKLKINYQETLLSSKTIIAAVNNVMGMVSLGNDDVGEDDVESNVVSIENYLDTSTGEIVDSTQLVLPGDSYRDITLLDWILSIKSEDDSTDELFNEYMTTNWQEKIDNVPKLNAVTLSMINAGYDRTGFAGQLDKQIDSNDSEVDKNIMAMREFYGEAEIAKMTPAKFYENYKKFSSGIIY